MDCVSSKEKKMKEALGAEKDSLTMPVLDLDTLWRNHPSFPPGFWERQDRLRAEAGHSMARTSVKAGPSLDMDHLWRTHPSFPPGFWERQDRLRAEAGHSMPRTPVKAGPSLDMDHLWRTHPSFPPGFWERRDAQQRRKLPKSLDEPTTSMDHGGRQSGGNLDLQESGVVNTGSNHCSSTKNNQMENQDNQSSPNPTTGPVLFTSDSNRNAGSAEMGSAPYSDQEESTPLLNPEGDKEASLHSRDKEEATVDCVNGEQSGNHMNVTETRDAPSLADLGENHNHQSSPATGSLLSTSDLNRNAGSADGVARPTMGLAYTAQNSIPLMKNPATFNDESILKTDVKGGQKKNTDLNKKPRQQKPKKKKHRPKVLVHDDGKKKKMTKKTPMPQTRPKVIPKTPKPMIPKPVIMKKARKGETGEIQSNTAQAAAEVTTKSCKKGLNFEVEAPLTEDVNAQSNGDVENVTHEYRLRHPYRSWKWRFNMNKEFLYGDEFYEDELQVIRKMIFSVFPRNCKKKRSRRRQALMRFLHTATCPTASLSSIRRKKRSRLLASRPNLASILALPVCDELPKTKLIPSEDPRKPAATRISEIGEGNCDKNFMKKRPPASATPPRQLSKKRKRKTKNMPLQIELPPTNINGWEDACVDSLVQGLNLLSLNDRNSQLALISHKKSTHETNFHVPKVDMDPQTLKKWNLIVFQSRGEGVEEKLDEKDEKRWEEEREVFRGRVNSFLACMHHLQGDRRFQPWKGSVLDSVVGVYLTQNVSDKLSSSAFMNMVALFPLPSSMNDSPCYIVEEDEEEDYQTLDQIPTVSTSYLKANMTTEANLCAMEKCNEIEKVENKNLNNSNAGKKGKNNNKENNSFDWDSLRRLYSWRRSSSSILNTKDSLDWEAVRNADVSHVSNAISTRGMNNILAARIKDFLDRLIREHERLDLEWLRNVPPEKAKDYLLSIKGLGLKSVECLRLLTLRHHAFPVDTNVARITIRLGWVPLQPLPSQVFLHSLDQYPPIDTIQKYLWPRLCTLDQKTLYELHYHMITFGKVFCTKRNPYCGGCPLKAECKHYASAMASRRPLIQNGDTREKGDNGQLMPPFFKQNQQALQKGKATPNSMYPNSVMDRPISSSMLISIHDDSLTFQSEGPMCMSCEPIIEVPASPELETKSIEIEEKDIEDFCNEDYDEIPTIRLDKEFRVGKQDDCPDCCPTTQEDCSSQALVSVATSIPTWRLKNISRLRTEHYVYELPDSHRLLVERGMRRESCDPFSFLLAVWSPGETSESFEQPQRKCDPEKPGELCNNETCSSCNAAREQESQTIRGTLLIPCRTAMRGSFPLNGTYFQVNEVFADDETSRNPIIVPRSEIWNLPRRVAYFGSSTTSIFRGLSILEIRNCFWKGYICLRGFNRKTRAPMPLVRRLHIPPSTIGRAKARDDEDL